MPTTAGTAPPLAHVPPKPRLRGALHLVAFPVSLLAGGVLLALADDPAERWACLVYTAAAAVLFGCSALYHRGTWDARTHARLRRLDHSNIFLMIAGTYTPLCVALLDGTTRVVVLVVVWVGALAGIVFRVAWLDAPAWLYTPFYVALGWVAIAVLPSLARAGGAAVDRARRGRRRGLQRRRDRVRPAPARPGPGHVRLPRAVPHGHDRRVRVPLRRHRARRSTDRMTGGPEDRW